MDLEWLRSFDSPATITLDEASQGQELTVLHVHTDQSGIVGLVRRLYGMGITSVQIEIV